jgi:hypothetical protein
MQEQRVKVFSTSKGGLGQWETGKYGDKHAQQLEPAKSSSSHPLTERNGGCRSARAVVE